MDREGVYRQVVSSAERFGINPQEEKLLASRFAKELPSPEVLAGLLLVFVRSEPGEAANFRKQELAGRLLAKLNPKASVDLRSTLRVVLPAYNPSIEQLPMYLAGRFGKDRVLAELHLFESEEHDARSLACSRTMRWWLNDGN